MYPRSSAHIVCGFNVNRTQPVDGPIYEGNDRFEGYSMDLIDAIARELKFQYRFELSPNNKYGSLNKITKQWDGMVKQLLDRARLI